MKRAVWIVAAAMLSGCPSSPSNPDGGGTGGGTGGAGGGSGGSAGDPGALIDLSLSSQVGVLLDELPAGPEREAAATEALALSDDAWKGRATRQVRLAFYRLVFRTGYYDPDAGRGPLPLTPPSVWKISLTGAATRTTVEGHDVVVRPYDFASTVVTDKDSPALVEPALAAVGGTWDEPFIFPVDPELIIERTGFACMDEDEYPPNSVFEENPWYFYDQTCDVEDPTDAYCHITQFPTEACTDALSAHVGSVSPMMHFARVAYDAQKASASRVGSITNDAGANLAVVQTAMQDEQRVFYRYFDGTDCSIVEGSVAHSGWRRLLAFSAVVRNDGVLPVHIGAVDDPMNPWVANNDFEYSPCHMHYHFSHYGTFGYNGAPGSKRAFCLEETNRFHNDETTPLWANHQSCNYQGIGPGWGDEYEFGIPGQWIDITDVNASTAHDLTFDSNVDQFMCEGQTLNDAGVPVDPYDLADIAFTPSTFKNSSGMTEGRIACKFPTTWNADNHGAVSVSLPDGASYVTQACTRDQTGPSRNCGFDDQHSVKPCTPGATVTVNCSTAGSVQVLRLCEASEMLGLGTACTLSDAVSNTVVTGAAADVAFTCPAVRDAVDAGTGGVALYVGAMRPSQPSAAVTCTGW